MSEVQEIAPVQTEVAPSWYASIPDPELVGHIQTKGWSRLEPAAAAAEAAKAHRAAERMLGAPADQMLRLPARSDDEAGWRQVYQRLGAPERAEDYAIDDLRFENPEFSDAFARTIRETATAANMPKAMAERMAQSIHRLMQNTGERMDAEKTAALKGEQDALTKDWGDDKEARFRANMFIADRAAEQLGVAPEQLQKLKEGLGASGVAKLFHRIGVAMGEDRFITGSNPAAQGLMSREQAFSRRSELMNDVSWVERYMKGGQPEKREMLALNTLISG